MLENAGDAQGNTNIAEYYADDAVDKCDSWGEVAAGANY